MTSGAAGVAVRLVAVDLDGTLVDSAPDLNHCVGEALAAQGFPRPTEADTRSWIGDGVEELLRRALVAAAPHRTPADFEQGGPGAEMFRLAFEAFSYCYERNLYARSRLYPRVAETLDALRGRGLALACITNKRSRFATGLLEQAGIADRFDVILGGDSLPAKKPSPAQLVETGVRLGVPAGAAMLVGDSNNDMAAARAAGWAFVWASYGYGRSLDAEPGGRVSTIARFDELAARLER